jgi:hypothetical protein
VSEWHRRHSEKRGVFVRPNRSELEPDSRRSQRSGPDPSGRYVEEADWVAKYVDIVQYQPVAPSSLRSVDYLEDRLSESEAESMLQQLPYASVTTCAREHNDI